MKKNQEDFWFFWRKNHFRFTAGTIVAAIMLVVIFAVVPLVKDPSFGNFIRLLAWYLAIGAVFAVIYTVIDEYSEKDLFCPHCFKAGAFLIVAIEPETPREESCDCISAWEGYHNPDCLGGKYYSIIFRYTLECQSCGGKFDEFKSSTDRDCDKEELLGLQREFKDFSLADKAD